LEEVQRQRRTSLKNIIILLLKTAATGVLATILDAAIEYRHRQLLGVPPPDPNEDTTTTDIFPSSSDASLHQDGYLSRSAITAWKSRLLYYIDEIECKLNSNSCNNCNNRRYASTSGLYCIQEEEEKEGEEGEEEDYYISSSSAPSAAAAAFSTVNKMRRVRAHTSLTHSPSLHTIYTEEVEDNDDRRASLAATVAQLTGLVQRGAPQRVVENKVELLMDSILPSRGTVTVTAEELEMVREEKDTIDHHDHHEDTDEDKEEEEGAMCQICMDNPLQLAASDCQHGLCISCARQLCSSSLEYDVPKCPFCRRAINSYEAYNY
jgi:hypothetical protein